MQENSSPPDPRPEQLVLVHSEGQVLEAWLQGHHLELTGRERLLLGHLAQQAEMIVLRDRLEEKVHVDTNGLYDLVYDLRRKLGDRYVRHRGGRARRGSGSSSGYALMGLKVSWVQTAVD